MARRIIQGALALTAALPVALSLSLAPAAATTAGWRVVKLYRASSQVDGIAATAAADAWAAGTTCGNPCSGSRLLVARWNGTAWAKMAPPAGSGASVGNAVTAASSRSNAWVFADIGANVDYAAAWRWNGTAWVDGAKFPAWSAIRSAVTFGARDAWAFGLLISPFAPYIAHYNGTKWQQVKLPVVPQAASATSSKDIWVIGQSAASGGAPVITMHYNGSSWREVALPKITLPAGEAPNAGSIVAVSPTDVWASAFPSAGQGVAEGIVLLHYNGVKWARVTVPYVSSAPNYLAPDGTGVWVSSYGKSYQPVLYRYLGGKWSQQAVPAPAGYSTQLGGLTAIPGTASVWGAGEVLPVPNPNGISRGAILKFGP